MDVRDDDVSKLGIDFIINNPSQKEVSLTGLEYYVYMNGESRGCEKLEERFEWLGFGLPKQSLQPLETATIKRKFCITGGEPLEQFLREGFINITVNGSLSVKIDTDSFDVPFEKATTVYLESKEEGKRAVCPNITGIELKTSKLVSTSGEITDIFINMSIIINNPNPVIIRLETLDYNVHFKKDGKWVRLSSGFYGSPSIEPMEFYTISVERRISDDEVIQYLMSGSPTDIRVRGSMFMFPKEKGWSPSYFESHFETVITTINGSGVSGEVTPTPTPSPTVSIISPTPSPIPGFEAIFAIAGLLAVAYILRKGV